MPFASKTLFDETGRQAALDQYGVLDTPPEPEFDDIVTLLRTIFGVSFAAVNLIDRGRQWAKAMSGFDQPVCPRGDSFCNVTIQGEGPLEVTDTELDARFRDNVFVTGAPKVRSYLGVPLKTPSGYNIGALCVFDTEPRSFTKAEHDVLTNFAKVVISQLELRQTANGDALTGALNRRAFDSKLGKEIDARQECSLILIDIDNFKAINDAYGHPVGDKALCAVIDCIEKLVREVDAVGRLGGEEFGVLLPRTGLEQAAQLAERLRESVALAAIPELGGKSVTISLGVAQYRPGETAQSWVERADAALYRAKRAGRNQTSLAA